MQSRDPESHRTPLPDVYVDRADPVEPGPYVTFDVDGELFSVGPDGRGGTSFTWLNGPNPGYGYGDNGRPDRSPEQHRADIRAFLSHIDPVTGYLD